MQKYIVLLFCIISLSVFADVEKVKENVIIDTDCSIDDLRAICGFLAIEESNILAITTSDGSLAPIEGKTKLNCLLNSLNKTNIPIAVGRDLKTQPPLWRDFSSKVYWGEEIKTSTIDHKDAVALIIEKVKSVSQSVTFICLGPLTNIYDAIKLDSSIEKNIKRIIWYNDKSESGFNYERDKKSADFVLSSGITVEIISNLNKDGAVITSDFIEQISSNSIYGLPVKLSHNKPEVLAKIKDNHLRLWDDLTMVYFLYPDLFDMKENTKNFNIKTCNDYNVNAVKEKILQIYTQTYSTDKNIVFNTFPIDTNYFSYDLKPVMNEIIKRYGLEEWKKCVLNNEIHGHLGSYSIIGAKMGIKAREILNAEIDRLDVLSFAGSEPPLSCMNDGLQISTGATLGVGKIKIVKDTILMPAAIFIYKGQKVKLVLKKEVQEKIDNDIREGIVKYGNLTDGYWKLVRAVSIKHWLEFDRNEIFDIIIN